MNSTDGYTTKAVDGGNSPVLLLAHGAGAPADSPFMEALATSLAGQGVAVVKFEFPYMQKRREDGRKRPPDRQDRLLECFRGQVGRVAASLAPGQKLFVGGKSMGGRMASLLAVEPEMSGLLAGVVCFGYPFHPPGKPDRWRTAHFGEVGCPLFIAQGTRDPFGKREEVGEALQAGIKLTLHWLEGGNHDFLPPKKQPETQEDLIREAAVAAARFIQAGG